MKTPVAKTFVALILLVLIIAAGCKHTTIVPVIPKQIQLKTSSTLGTYLADREGHTLYMFASDANGQPSCTGSCEATWPPFNVIDLKQEDLDTSLRMSDFNVLQNASGKKQLTYKGWPLYYHAPAVNGSNVLDSVGVTAGDGIAGIWFIAKPDYTIMLANAQLVGHDGKNYKPDYTEGTGKTIYFTDGAGNTLYFFRFDTNNKNTYTKNTTPNSNSVWPIYQNNKIVVPSALDKTLFRVIDVFGKPQLTYKGWPLYYFEQDNTRGLNKGVSFPSPAIWPVAIKNATVAP